MTPLDRRSLLKLIAGGAAATVAACSRPDENIFPLANQPEGTLPGVVRRYPTALPFAGYMRGVTGLVVDERPIKLEGLATHPASLGATDLFTEVSILDLYDPQRLRTPAGPAGPAAWEEAGRAIWTRIAPRRGEGTVLLTGRITSPTLLARIAALRAQFPGVRHVRWEPFDDDDALAGAELAFGRPLTARPRLGEADAVLCLGADPLGPGPEQVAIGRAWSDRRRRGPAPRLYVLEPSLTQTGVMADVRAAAGPRELALACRALAGEGANLPAESGRLLAAFRSAPGRKLVLAGDRQPAPVHALAAHLNGGLGAPVDYLAPIDPDPTPHRAGMAALLRDMQAGRVDTLIVLDANPAYAVPGFADAMRRVPLTVAASRLPTETCDAARWTLPLPHPLESWHDGRAPDGTASIAQPLVRPFYDTRTPVEFIDWLIDPAAGYTAYRRHREQWAALGEAGWRQALLAGVVPNTAAAPVTVGSARLALPPVPPAGLVLEVRPSSTLWDGRFAANAWAQECPDPVTKEVWGASVRMHPADMVAKGLKDGDLVKLGDTTAPVHALASQAPGVATALAGGGRRASGAVATGVGGNAFAAAGVIGHAAGKGEVLTTQHQFRLDGELGKLFPVLGPGERTRVPPPPATLLPNPPHPVAPPQWAMAIDTDVCIGCNACVVACQAENNVPAIGPGEIGVGRDMHWLRVDYYEDEDGAARGFQPVPCMHCETAPCEPVCPVEASIHDTQGLNLQVYNRCVGTRTCQANCPYKVRRFNFLDYPDHSLWGDAEDASVAAQRNPDVTVRARGVMEKCTYCIQRIEQHDRSLDATGEAQPVVTACQAACPTRAITFGTLDDSPIRDARASDRHYALLGDLGTKPRTTYLARRRDADGGKA